MVKSDKNFYRLISMDYEKNKDRHLIIYAVILATVFLFGAIAVAQEREDPRVGILPLKVYSSTPMDRFDKEFRDILGSSLAGKGLNIVASDLVNKHPKTSMPFLKQTDIVTIGRDLNADWLIIGSATLVGEKVSIDLKVMDIKGIKMPYSIYIVEDSVDRVDDAISRSATSIYNHITGAEHIESIRVEGNKRIEADAIMAIIESQGGQTIDREQLDRDLRSIFKMGFFKDVNVEIEKGLTGKIVIFRVYEKPSITEISFKGNKKGKEENLEEELGIKKYSILNRTEVKHSINRLKEYYHKKGYYNVEIKESIEELPNNEVALIYDIDEGNKIFIYEIDFVGNEEYEDEDLKDLMETSEKGIFSLFTDSGKLDRNKLEFDIQKIVSFYHNNGYIKAKAGVPEISYNEDKGIKITIEIIEGPQYRVGEVQIAGDLIFPKENLMARIGINKEEFFDREQIRNDILTLNELYSSKGYVYADIAPSTKEYDEEKIIDITYNISKKERVRVERLNIKGNTRTRDKVIRRELPLVEGEYFNGIGLKDGSRNLYRLGFFENVEVQTKKGSQDDLMILDINITEGPTGSFMVGAGYDSWNGIVGTFELTEKNFLGRGQNISAKASLGERSIEYDLSFTEPWLFGRPISGGINLFRWETEYDEYTEDSIGGGPTIGFPLKMIDKYTRGSIKYAYADTFISDVDDDASIVIKDSEGTTISSSMTFGITRNSIDNPMNTTQGSINSLSFEYAGGFFGGDAYFNKYTGRSAWFIPCWKKTVIMIQGKMGYIEPRSGGIIPVFDKFYLGGIQTVRGYDYREISPRDPETDDKIGGEKMWVYNLEYRFPLLQELGVYGVIFYDAGNVYTDDQDFSLDGRMSFGGGFRWISPIGPIRIEYGRKINRQPGESSGEWEFAFGGTF